MPRSHFTPGKDPIPIVQEAGWAMGPVWTGAENLAPTGIRSPDRPARSSVTIPTELPGPLLTNAYEILRFARAKLYITLSNAMIKHAKDTYVF
jgi:predicted membrane protein